MGTNNRTAQCRCLQCGRLFRLGVAIQVVSAHPKSFHHRQLIFLCRLEGGQQQNTVNLPHGLRQALASKLLLTAGVSSPRGLQRASSALGIDFRAAVSEDFGGILHRLAALVFEIHGQKIDHVAEFVQ